RGYRVELGEVEAALGQHAGVRQAVVVAPESASGDRWLAAYVVSQGEGRVSAAELRSFLKEKLPEYMVPLFVALLAELPLTPNGKLDRKRLPAPEQESGGRKYDAPRTPAEELLTAIWAEVLQLERVGRQDNFFELGGHSLLAMQVI